MTAKQKRELSIMAMARIAVEKDERRARARATKDAFMLDCSDR
ncbi:hypothetical protein [Rhizobium tumorigenes]|uniref:Uncharacterized protein n=1 Tax=Rhizobium tumorigenes TaxID=2041385 RepID=A0AAF1K5W6_9HYPH|nr:hypothetical protein [Rhizobium tumorigenes]WFR96290.1 hypothetical protein PR017_03910 [Rhizobium tumorigenes]